MKKITLLITLFCFSIGFSQTFTDAVVHDLQNGNGGTALTCGTADELNLPLAVTGVGTLGGTNSIESVTINITHTWNSDVRLSLVAPDGTTTLELINANVGGSGDGFTDCVLIDGGATLPGGATTPVTGSFAPQGAGGFASFNSASIAADGNWTLFACDNANGDVGTIDSWSITFITTPSCIPATFTLADGGNNCPLDEFFIDVDVTALGSATTVNILNDGGASAINAVDGTASPYSVGPFTTGTDVTITVEDAADSACNAATNLVNGACPPANDDACNATVIVVGNAPATYTNEGATTETDEPGGSCWFVAGSVSNSVWFEFTIGVDTDITVSTDFATGGTLADTQIAVYSGDCMALLGLTEVDCDDDDGVGLLSIAIINGLSAGTYLIQVEGFGTDVGTFDLEVTGIPLSVEGFENESAFTYYPNPVKNSLSLKAVNEIQNVSIYNMLGQEVLRTAPNAIEKDIDMDSLQSGTYFVQVTINNVTETVRIIKQ